MKSLFSKLHIPALIGLVGNIIGISDLIARPEIAPALPHIMPDAWAVALVAVCTAIQALTKAIHSGDTPQ